MYFHFNREKYVFAIKGMLVWSRIIRFSASDMHSKGSAVDLEGCKKREKHVGHVRQNMDGTTDGGREQRAIAIYISLL